MTPKDFIRQAIFQAEKKYLPHFYTDDVETYNIYKNFKTKINEYYVTLLDNQKIKKITAGDGVNTYCDLTDYLSSINIKKQKTRDFLLDMQKNYYKNKPSRNKKTDYILKSIQDYALDFIDEIDNELKNLNNINYNMTSKEENLLKTKSKFSLEEGVLPFSDLAEANRFKELTKQSSLMVLGEPSEQNINDWINKFCENAPKAMEAVGFNEQAISLNETLTYYYSNNLCLQTENAFIEYDKNTKPDSILYISFDHYADNNASSILHEWTHGLDLAIGSKLYNKTHYISSDFMIGQTILNRNHELHDTINKGQEAMASALGGTDYEIYKENKKIVIDYYKEKSTEMVGKTICKNIKSDWFSLSEEQQQKLKDIPEFKNLVTLPIKYLRANEETAQKIVGKHIYAIFKSPEYKEIFPEVEHLTISPRAKILLEWTQVHSLENNISWFKTGKKEKNGFYENFAFTDTDFSIFSSARGQYKKHEYLFLPHELFARMIQTLALEPIYHEPPIRNDGVLPVYQDREISTKASARPEQTLLEKAQLIDLVQTMAMQIGIHPNKKIAQVLEKNRYQYVNNEHKVAKRGSLVEKNIFLKKIKQISKNNIKKHTDKINNEIQSLGSNNTSVNKMKIG